MDDEYERDDIRRQAQWTENQELPGLSGGG
jgi:hypothetical protein